MCLFPVLNGFFHEISPVGYHRIMFFIGKMAQNSIRLVTISKLSAVVDALHYLSSITELRSSFVYASFGHSRS